MSTHFSRCNTAPDPMQYFCAIWKRQIATNGDLAISRESSAKKKAVGSMCSGSIGIPHYERAASIISHKGAIWITDRKGEIVSPCCTLRDILNFRVMFPLIVSAVVRERYHLDTKWQKAGPNRIFCQANPGKSHCTRSCAFAKSRLRSIVTAWCRLLQCTTSCVIMMFSVIVRPGTNPVCVFGIR